MSAPTWSATRLKTWHRCTRLHHYRYNLDLGEPTADVAAFGKVGHEHLEGDLRIAMGEIATPPTMLPDHYEQARLYAVIDGYRERWTNSAWNVLGVEVPFQYELAGHIITGRMDGIVQDKSNGQVLVLEHKFTSSDASPGSAYWDRLALDLQIACYVDGASVLGYDVAGVIYDVIAKPAHKVKRATPVDQRKYTLPTKGKGCKVCGGSAGGKKGVIQGDGEYHGPPPEDYETTAGAETPLFCEACQGSGWTSAPEPARLYKDQRETDETPDEFYNRIVTDIAERPSDFYARAVIVRTEDEIPKMRADILDTIKLARIAEMFDVHPRNSDACNRYGSRCWFWDACVGAADISDVIRFPRRTRDESPAPAPQP